MEPLTNAANVLPPHGLHFDLHSMKANPSPGALNATIRGLNTRGGETKRGISFIAHTSQPDIVFPPNLLTQIIKATKITGYLIQLLIQS